MVAIALGGGLRSLLFSVMYSCRHLPVENLVHGARLRRAEQLSRHLHHVVGRRIEHVDDEADQIRICGGGSSLHQRRQTSGHLVVVLGDDAVRPAEVVRAVAAVARLEIRHVVGADVGRTCWIGSQSSERQQDADNDEQEQDDDGRQALHQAS